MEFGLMCRASVVYTRYLLSAPFSPLVSTVVSALVQMTTRCTSSYAPRNSCMFAAADASVVLFQEFVCSLCLIGNNARLPPPINFME